MWCFLCYLARSEPNFKPASGPGYTTKDLSLPAGDHIYLLSPVQGIYPKTLASAFPLVRMIATGTSRPSPCTGVFEFSWFLHVLVNLFAVQLHWLWCDGHRVVIFTLNSLTEGRSARDLPKQHRKKNLSPLRSSWRSWQSISLYEICVVPSPHKNLQLQTKTGAPCVVPRPPPRNSAITHPQIWSKNPYNKNYLGTTSVLCRLDAVRVAVTDVLRWQVFWNEEQLQWAWTWTCGLGAL